MIPQWMLDAKARLNEVSPYPWAHDDSCDVVSTTEFEEHDIPKAICSAHYGKQPLADCKFIASCPTDLAQYDAALRVAIEALGDIAVAKNCDGYAEVLGGKLMEVARCALAAIKG